METIGSDGYAVPPWPMCRLGFEEPFETSEPEGEPEEDLLVDPRIIRLLSN